MIKFLTSIIIVLFFLSCGRQFAVDTRYVFSFNEHRAGMTHHVGDIIFHSNGQLSFGSGHHDIFLDTGSWQRIDRRTIELILKDDQAQEVLNQEYVAIPTMDSLTLLLTHDHESDNFIQVSYSDTNSFLHLLYIDSNSSLDSISVPPTSRDLSLDFRVDGAEGRYSRKDSTEQVLNLSIQGPFIVINGVVQLSYKIKKTKRGIIFIDHSDSEFMTLNRFDR